MYYVSFLQTYSGLTDCEAILEELTRANAEILSVNVTTMRSRIVSGCPGMKYEQRRLMIGDGLESSSRKFYRFPSHCVGSYCTGSASTRLFHSL